MRIISRSGLPAVRLDGEVLARVFDGGENGVDVSAFIVDTPPGLGPRRHLHPYDEVFVLIEGRVRLEAGGETRDLGPDDICVVPSGVAHSFVGAGSERARMVNIHASRNVVTEFVDVP